MKFQILAVSDEVDQRIYSPSIRERMGDVHMVIGCGDLPANYLEFLSDALLRPVYYVLGNHAEELSRSSERGHMKHPEGCIDLGGKVVQDPATGLILAGLPGSVRYTENEPVQYTEWQMLWMILKMAPRLIRNRIQHGRALDVLVTHSPPRHVGDRDDVAHRGFKTMRRFLRWFRPEYQVHGHVHLYDRSKPNVVRFMDTDVINVFPYQRLELVFRALRSTESAPERASASDRSSAGVKHSP